MKGAVCIAVMLVAAPLSAQMTGTLRPIAPASVDGNSRDAAREAMRQFGNCALRKSPGFVAKALQVPLDSPEYDRWIRRVANDECLGTGTMKFSVPTMRGALFEASYILYFATNGPTDFTAVGPIDYVRSYGRTAAALRAAALAQFGDCVARADGANARALVLAPPASGSETAAISALRPRLTGCVEKNVEMNFDRSAFRAAVTEGLYRLTQAATGTTTQTATKE